MPMASNQPPGTSTPKKPSARKAPIFKDQISKHTRANLHAYPRTPSPVPLDYTDLNEVNLLAFDLEDRLSPNLGFLDDPYPEQIATPEQPAQPLIPILNPHNPNMAEAMAPATVKIWRENIGMCDGSDPVALFEWLKQVDALFAVTEAHAASFLSVMLHLSKKELAHVMIGCTRDNWEARKDLIMNNFLGPQHAEKALTALANLNQGNDTPRQYVTKFRQTHAMTGMADAPHIRGLFLKGLDKSIYMYCSQPPPADLATCYTRALACSHQAQTPVYSVSGDPTAVAFQEQTRKDIRSLTAAVNKLAQCSSQPKFLKNSPGTCAASSDECYKCGQKGHFAKACPNPRNPRLQGNQPRPAAPADPKCDRCRRTGHITRDCRASPPKAPCRTCNGAHWMFDCPHKATN